MIIIQTYVFISIAEYRLVNDARAMRIAELVNDFRNTQYYLSSFAQIQPVADEYYLQGYVLLREVVQGAASILAGEFATERHPRGNVEKEKKQLQTQVLKLASSIQVRINHLSQGHCRRRD